MTTPVLNVAAAVLSLFAVATWAEAQERADALHVWKEPKVQVGNVFPHISVYAKGVGSESETGIGALIPWADRLWAIGYVAHIKGKGIGLYELTEGMQWRLHPESVTGTFANRLVHWPSKQAIIGPHVIDAEGKVRTFQELSKHRLTATALHLIDPKNKVYFCTMEGLLFEADVNTLESKKLFDLNDELKFPKTPGAYPHYKGCFSAQGRLVVANNSYAEEEYLGQRHSGRLAEWNGKGDWKTLEENPFIEVSGKQNPTAGGQYGNPLYAVGWDNKSVIYRVLHKGNWQRYRLPFGSRSWEHFWNTEWMRIREVQTERYLMDAFGIIYDMPPLHYGGHTYGIKPVCNHLRIIPDMCHFRGLFVLAGDQTDNAVGQPQSGLWFGNVDDLWKWGKPSGWGAVWKEEEVKGVVTSDAFLMTGFDKKSLHVINHGINSAAVFVEVDVLGDGKFRQYAADGALNRPVADDSYTHYEFPDGFSAHWVRLRAECKNGTKITAQFFYN
jgi:hypothetical protein